MILPTHKIMGRNQLLSIALGMLSLIAASPTATPRGLQECDGPSKRHGCLTDHEADVLRNRYISFFVEMDAKEQALTSNSIVDNFIYQSDSLNWLFDKTATYVAVSILPKLPRLY